MLNRCVEMHNMEIRSEAGENGEDLYLEGYFVRYDDVYHVAENATESIARGAFAESINGDIRALYNHNSDLVLGRTSAGTLTLRDTDAGLWGRIKINQNDRQAMDAYERIARGDISGCSFGFDIPEGGEDVTIKEDGSIHWTIKRVDPLYEVSPCTFPAYEATSIAARERDAEVIRKRALDAWKETMKGRIKNA